MIPERPAGVREERRRGDIQRRLEDQPTYLCDGDNFWRWAWPGAETERAGLPALLA